jgi:hypothetical protein
VVQHLVLFDFGLEQLNRNTQWLSFLEPEILLEEVCMFFVVVSAVSAAAAAVSLTTSVEALQHLGCSGQITSGEGRGCDEDDGCGSAAFAT